MANGQKSVFDSVLEPSEREAVYEVAPKPKLDKYDTALNDAEEKQFQEWKQKNAPHDSGQDYDLRGAFKEGLSADTATGHWPDTYKKPNHPTFSNQSKFAVGADAAKAGSWEGEQFTPAKGNKSVFDEVLTPEERAAVLAPVSEQQAPQEQVQKKPSVFEEEMKPQELTPSGKPAFNEDGTPSRAYFDEVYKKRSALQGFGEGVKGVIESGKKTIAAAAHGDISRETMLEAPLAAADFWMGLGKGIKNKVVDIAGRVTGEGKDWETNRQYERWIENLKEEQRRAGGASRLGDFTRTILNDPEMAKALDERVNQEQAGLLSLVADPSLYLTGGGSGLIRVAGRAAGRVGGALAKGVMGAERAAQLGEAVSKGAATVAAATPGIIKKPLEAMGTILESPTATAIETGGKVAGATAKGLENVVGPVLENIAARPVLTGSIAAAVTQAETDDTWKALMAGIATATGLKSNLFLKTLGKSGKVAETLRTAEQIAKGTGEAIRTEGLGFKAASKEAADLTAKGALSEAGGFKLGTSGAKETFLGKGLKGVDVVARYITDPALKASIHGAGLGYISGDDVRDAAEWAGMGLVIGPFGHLQGRAIGQLSRVNFTPRGVREAYENAQTDGIAKRTAFMAKMNEVPEGERTPEKMQEIKDSITPEDMAPYANAARAMVKQVPAWQVYQDPAKLNAMTRANDRWLKTLPEASRTAIEANRPTEDVLFKMGEDYRRGTGETPDLGTGNVNNMYVYRDGPAYDAILGHTGGQTTAGATESVSDALARVQVDLAGMSDGPEKTALSKFAQELQTAGAKTVMAPDGTVSADVKNGSRKKMIVVNTDSAAFQVGGNQFHEGGHGAMSLFISKEGRQGGETKKMFEERLAAAQQLEAAQAAVKASYIGVRDENGNLIVGADGKPVMTGQYNDADIDNIAAQYVDAVPDQHKARLEEAFKNRAFKNDFIVSELIAEGHSEFARRSPASVSERARAIARPGVMDKVARMLNIREYLRQQGVQFIDYVDPKSGSLFLKDRNGDAVRMTREQEKAIAELITLQEEYHGRMESGEVNGDPGRVITQQDIMDNPALAAEVIASGAVETRQKTVAEIREDATKIFVENNQRAPTEPELQKTVKDGLSTGAIPGDVPVFKPDGKPKILTPTEIKRRDTARTEAIIDAMDSLGQEADPNALQRIVSADGVIRYAGRYMSPRQLDAVLALPDAIVPLRMKIYLQQANGNLSDPALKGTPMQWIYYAATKGGRYSSGISQSFRVASPTSIQITKARNFVVNTFDHGYFDKALRKAIAEQPAFLDLWGGGHGKENAKAASAFLGDVEKYLANHEQGLPGATGLDADATASARKGGMINDFFNIKDKETAYLKDGTFPDNQFYRALRIDRTGSLSEADVMIFDRRMRLPIDLRMQKQRFMPEVGQVGAKEKPLQFMPSGDGKTLVAIHNTNLDGIREALRLGGIPSPSLAIAKKDAAPTGFGAITLIAKPESVNPENLPSTKVFEADIYSQRQVRPVMKANSKAASVLEKDIATGLPASYVGHAADAVEKVLKAEGMTSAITEAGESIPFILAYLREKGTPLEIPMETKSVRSDIGGSRTLREAVDAMSEDEVKRLSNIRFQSGDEVHKELSELWKRIDDADLKELMDINIVDNDKVSKLHNEARDRKFNEETGLLNFHEADNLSHDIGDIKSGAQQVDQGALRDIVSRFDRKISESGSEEEFRAWVHKKIAPAIEKEHLPVPGKPPVTLENVSAAMGSRVRAKEGGMMAGSLGSARARTAKALLTMKMIKSKEHKLISDDDMQFVKNDLNDRAGAIFGAFPDQGRYGKSIFESGQVIGDYLAAGRKTDDGMMNALRRNGFVGEFTPDILKDLRSLAHDLTTAPTEYFEAKLLRPVRWDEFGAAVVPEGTPAKVIEALKSRGLAVSTYPSHNEAQRKMEVLAHTDLHFMPEGKTPDFPVPEKPETVAMQMEELANGTRDAAYFAKGTVVPAMPQDMEAVHSNGNVLVFDPKKIKKEAAQAAVDSGNIGKMIGMQTETKPDIKDVVGAVVHRRNGMEVSSELVTAATKDAALKAKQARAQPGDTVAIEEPWQVVEGRTSGLSDAQKQVILKADGAEQFKWIDERAKASGYEGAGDLLDKNNPQFQQWRADWREANPRQKPNKDVMYMPEVKDADYMKAVEGGDTAAAQKMVDEAAKSAGYVARAGHATPYKFNEFDRAKISNQDPDTRIRGFHFSTEPSEQASYVSGSGIERGKPGKTKIVDSYIKLGKVLGRHEAEKMVWDQLKEAEKKAPWRDRDPNLSVKKEEIEKFRREVVDAASFPKGYDTVEFLKPWELTKEKQKEFEETGKVDEGNYRLSDSKDRGVELFRKTSDGGMDHITGYETLKQAYDMHAEAHYIVRDPNQIKSADAITRDDAGNVIPLSQRFNAGNKDIRFMPESRAQPAEDQPMAQVENARVTTKPGLIQFLPAYHGTPHEVEKFSTEKVGTGEGAQVYGWGLYFAEEPKVAQEYQMNLSNAQLFYEGKKVGTVDPFNTKSVQEMGEKMGLSYLESQDLPTIVRDYVHGGNSWDAVKKGIAEKSDYFRPKYEALFAKIKDKLEIKSKGSIYTVDLDVKPEELLDWDAQFPQQSQKVKEALKVIGMTGQRGQDIYRALSGKELPVVQEGKGTTAFKRSASPENASEFLSSMGIKGIRYLDQGSRGVGGTGKYRVEESASTPGEWVVVDAGTKVAKEWFSNKAAADRWIEAETKSQTYNYVMFDESRIKITEKNGKAVTMERLGKEEGGAQFMPDTGGKSASKLEEESIAKAERYFQIGQDNPNADNWIYDASSRAIKSKVGGTHGINFGHDVADKTFKGWHDSEEKKVSVVFPQSESKKLDHEPTVDDIPTGVFNAITRKFGKGNEIIAFMPDAGNAIAWRKDFPKAISLTTISKMFTLGSKDGEQTAWAAANEGTENRYKSQAYIAAKSGDADAAVDLARDMISDEGRRAKLAALFEAHPDAMLVPVIAEEASGRNRIPHAMATVIGDEFNIPVEENVMQSNRAHRTGKNAIYRMMNPVKFDGKIEAGREYVLVDDVITQGGTVNDLRQHIEAQGGTVVGVVAAGVGYSPLLGHSGQLAIKAETVKGLDEKFGRDILETILNEHGITNNVEALTESQGKFILKSFKNADEFRNRISEDGQQTDGGENAEEVGGVKKVGSVKGPLASINTGKRGALAQMAA